MKDRRGFHPVHPRARLLIGLLLALFTGSARAATPDRAAVVGSWINVSPQFSTYVTYGDDGTFRGQLKQADDVLWRFAGTWSLAADGFRYEYTESSTKHVPVGHQGLDQLVVDSKDQITFVNADGRRSVYKRVERAP